MFPSIKNLCLVFVLDFVPLHRSQFNNRISFSMQFARRCCTNMFCDFFFQGEILAKDLDCTFSEVAASEQVTQVADVFHEVNSLHGLLERKEPCVE